MAELSCQDFDDRVGDYVDGVLPSTELAAMEGHRLACPRCSELLVDYHRIPALLRAATDVGLSAGAQVRLGRLISALWRRRS